MSEKRFFEKIKEYHFEFKHVTVLFIILFAFQLIVSFINKAAVKSFLSTTQEWYQKDSAEEIANLTTTSLELVLESIDTKAVISREEENKVIQAFNIIFSQQQLKHNIQGLYILTALVMKFTQLMMEKLCTNFFCITIKLMNQLMRRKKILLRCTKRLKLN